MIKGIEILLERGSIDRSLFQQARDLEMKQQWDIATAKYRQLLNEFSASSAGIRNSVGLRNGEILPISLSSPTAAASASSALLEETVSAYYRCLQNGGQWEDLQHFKHSASNSSHPSQQTLYWNIEASWRDRDWPRLRTSLNRLEWVISNQQSSLSREGREGRRRRRREKGREAEEEDEKGNGNGNENEYEFGYYLGRALLALQDREFENVEVRKIT